MRDVTTAKSYNVALGMMYAELDMILPDGTKPMGMYSLRSELVLGTNRQGSSPKEQ